MSSIAATNISKYKIHRLVPNIILPSKDITLDTVDDTDFSGAVYNIAVWQKNEGFANLVNWKTGRGVGKMRLDVLVGEPLGSVYAPFGFGKDRIVFVDLENKAYRYFREANDRMQGDHDRGIIANANLLEFLDSIHKGSYTETRDFMKRFEVVGLVI